MAMSGTPPAILPGAWLGLLGGGQLGRMFCMAAQSLGYKVGVLDPDASSPAGSVADRHLHADYLDARRSAELARAARRDHRIRERAGRGARSSRAATRG